MYFEGLGIDQDYTKARELLQRATSLSCQEDIACVSNLITIQIWRFQGSF